MKFARRYLLLYMVMTTLMWNTPKMAAADVVVDSSIDSTMILLGDQTAMRISVTCDTGQRVDFPLFSDTVVTGLELLGTAVTDTQYVNRKQRMTITRKYTLTSFEEKFYYIDPFPIYVDSVPFSSGEPLTLDVVAFEVDTLHPENFFGPHEIMQMPFKWQDLKTGVISLVLAVLLALLTVFLILRYMDDKPIIRIIRRAPKIPAHQKALEQIEQIREEKMPHSEDAKAYYTALTDALRLYMNERFGFNATEMTTSEIIENLEKTDDKEAIREMNTLFSTADLVKFAKFRPMLNENDQNLINAVEFVNKTKVEPTEEEMKEKVETIIEEKRSRKARYILLVSAIIASAALAYFIYLTIREVLFLFF